MNEELVLRVRAEGLESAHTGVEKFKDSSLTAQGAADKFADTLKDLAVGAGLVRESLRGVGEVSTASASALGSVSRVLGKLGFREAAADVRHLRDAISSISDVVKGVEDFQKAAAAGSEMFARIGAGSNQAKEAASSVERLKGAMQSLGGSGGQKVQLVEVQGLDQMTKGLREVRDAVKEVGSALGSVRPEGIQNLRAQVSASTEAIHEATDAAHRHAKVSDEEASSLLNTAAQAKDNYEVFQLLQDGVQNYDQVVNKATTTTKSFVAELVRMGGFAAKTGGVLESVAGGGAAVGASMLLYANKAKASLVSLGQTVQNVASGVPELIGKAKAFGATALPIAGVGLAVYGVGAAVTAVYSKTKQATEQIVEFARAGDGVRSIKTSFEALGGTSKQLDTLRAATKGVVDEMTLMSLSNVAKFNNLNLTQMKQAAEIALGAATATGQSVKDAFTNIVQGTVKGEVELFDQYGIKPPPLDKIKKDWAKAKGVAVDALSQDDVQNAFWGAIYDEAKVQRQLGETLSSSAIAQFDTLKENFKNSFSEVFVGIFEQAGGGDMLKEGLMQVQDIIGSISEGEGARFIATIGTAFAQSFSVVSTVLMAVMPLLKLALDIFNAFQPALMLVVQPVALLTVALTKLVSIGILPVVQALKVLLIGAKEAFAAFDVKTPNIDRAIKSIDNLTASALALPDEKLITVTVETQTKTGNEGQTPEQIRQRLVDNLVVAQELEDISLNALRENDRLARQVLATLGADVSNMTTSQIQGLTQKLYAEGLAAQGREVEAAYGQLMERYGHLLDESWQQAIKGISTGEIEGGMVTRALMEADDISKNPAVREKIARDIIAFNNLVKEASAKAPSLELFMGGIRDADNALGYKSATDEGVKNLGRLEKSLGLVFDRTKTTSVGLGLLDSSVSKFGKALDQLGMPKDVVEQTKELAKEFDKLGLKRTEGLLTSLNEVDAVALAESVASVTALSDAGDELTGSQALLQNVLRQTNGDYKNAKERLGELEKALDAGGVAVYRWQTALKNAGGWTSFFENQLQEWLNTQRAARDNLEKAQADLEAYKPPKKGGKDKTTDILDRAELLGLTEYQKEIVSINRQFHKDMKAAGKDLDLINATQKIQAANIAKASKEMWEPVLDGARQRWNDLKIATAQQNIEIAKMLTDSQEELRVNNLKHVTVVDPLDMIGFSKDNLKTSVQSFFKGEGGLSSLASSAVKDVQAILSTVKIRPATDEEKNIERQLSALRTEQEEKLSILTQGSEAYLAVKATFAEREAQLERQRSAIIIEEEHKRVWAGAEAFAQLQSETANFNSYIDGMTQTAARNTAFFAEGLLGGMSAVKAAADQMSAIDQQLALGTIQASQAESKKMQAALGASGKFIAGFIKDQRAQAGVLGAMEIGHAAAAFAGNPIPDPWGGAAHLLAAAKYFAVSASGSGGGAGSRPEPPRRATALSNRDQKGGGRERQSREVTNIIIQPLSGEVIVRSANKAAAKNVNVKFHGGLMGGEFRRTDY